MAVLKTIDRESPFNTSDGNLRFNFLLGVPCVRQTADTRLKTFKTEFYYNKAFGVDWYGVVLNQASQPIERESELNDMLSGTTGVNSLVSSNLLVDKQSQNQYYTAKIVSDGTLVDVTQAFPNNQGGV